MDVCTRGVPINQRSDFYGTSKGATRSNDMFGKTNSSFNSSNSANNYIEFGNTQILDLITSFRNS